MGGLVGRAVVSRSQPDPPGIDKARWIALIPNHPSLSRAKPIDAKNPFTGEPTKIYPPGSTAAVVVAGQRIGILEWCLSDGNDISVYGEPAVMIPMAKDIAGLLGGFFEKWEG
jgi:hypothetical protein